MLLIQLELSGILTEVGDWRLIFYVNIPVAIGLAGGVVMIALGMYPGDGLMGIEATLDGSRIVIVNPPDRPVGTAHDAAASEQIAAAAETALPPVAVAAVGDLDGDHRADLVEPDRHDGVPGRDCHPVRHGAAGWSPARAGDRR